MMEKFSVNGFKLIGENKLYLKKEIMKNVQ
jgi:hypothetical protein